MGIVLRFQCTCCCARRGGGADDTVEQIHINDAQPRRSLFESHFPICQSNASGIVYILYTFTN